MFRHSSLPPAALSIMLVISAAAPSFAAGIGSVKGWGSDAFGNLGNGPSEGTDCGSFGCYASPTPIPAGANVVAISTAADFTFALLTSGRVLSWGEENEALGRPFTDEGDEGSAPRAIPSLSNVKGISAGLIHGLAVLRDGTVRAWGDGGFGVLGNGSINTSLNGVVVKGLRNVVAVAAGDFHSLALDSTGQVWVWGDDFYGQLGDGGVVRHCEPSPSVAPCSSVPVKVPGLTDVVAIRAGGLASLALRRPGVVTVRASSATAAGRTSVATFHAGERRFPSSGLPT